ncbi:DUF229 domain-containing protein [Thermococcus sp. LS1]|uniref:sulfatase-like hydrolase/transferase n=1 Tax=Thermococcus sp. LS1 TaxID=1638259 RepID=UPI00143C2FA9|nr:sulfatase-like hydrolase/transferase [Thermococcus sp. LS1]NJD98747.1 DUF229 domain-containing protein [Thermococcus sp. LS1]
MDSSHVIFIMLDTLRKDYGKVIEDSLSQLGFVSYDWAITPAPWTLPAHASIFSGLYPALHGAHETRDKKNFEVRFKGPNSLLQSLDEMGYKTHLLSANMFIRPEFGFSDFYEFYDIYPSRPFSLLSRDEKLYLQKLMSDVNGDTIKVIWRLFHNSKYKLLLKIPPNLILSRLHRYYKMSVQGWPIEKGSRKAVKLIKSFKFDDPTFVFMNLMEVHQPLFVNKSFSYYLNLRERAIDDRTAQEWHKKYYKATRYLERQLNQLFSILKDKGIFDEAFIIVLSDHGELIGERGKILHGTFLYDELLRVPLMIKYPSSWDVEIEKREGYVSLTSLASFLIGLLKGQVHSDGELYSETVFAESYGVSNPIDPSLLSEAEKIRYSELNRYRIAVYHRGFKGVFNIADWRFEEVVSYKGDIEPTEADIKNLKKEVVRFLKMSTSAKIPRIKL